MLNLEGIGRPIAKIYGGRDDGEILYVDSEENNSDVSSEDSAEADKFTEYSTNGKMAEILNPYERSISYICGPSGSGKTTHAIELIKGYIKVYPKCNFFLFSRTDYRNDPAYKGMKVSQVSIDETLLDSPIDIETEIPQGS